VGSVAAGFLFEPFEFFDWHPQVATIAAVHKIIKRRAIIQPL
jgi:hypothetical protein